MKGNWLIICIVMQSKHLWAPFPYTGVLGSQEDCVFKESLAKPPPPPLSTSAPARQGLESFVAHHYSIRKSHSHEREQRGSRCTAL